MLTILTFLGCIGLLLFALKLISEGLQKIAGDHLRHAQAGMTGHRLKGMFTGLGISALVQSSVVTASMAVSFVNAGIITLAQSMAIIMGANIGTTFAAWLVAIVGFQFDIAVWSFPIIAIALPFFSSRKSTTNSWGELLLGVALLLIAIATLQDVFSTASTLASVQGICAFCADYTFWLLLIFFAVGIVLTILVQTSIVTFLLALLACSNGWITLPIACATMLGANIGTCIPLLITSRRGNAMARRAALGHLLFNVIGTVWALSAFPYVCQFTVWICEATGLCQPLTPAGSHIGLALFHSLFNIITMLLLLPLCKQLVRIVTSIIPDQASTEEQSFKLQYITGDLLPQSGEMALVQVQKEVSRYGEDTYKMFSLMHQMVKESMGSERQLELMERVRQMEEDSDDAELQIAQFLNKIQPQTLSMSGEQLCRSLYKVVDELESIADCVFHCSAALRQKGDQLIRFTPDMNTSLRQMLQLTDNAMRHMTHCLSLDEMPANALNRAYNYEDEINNLRNQLRNQMLLAIERREIEFQQHSCFVLLINECEKIGDYVINVIAAASI